MRGAVKKKQKVITTHEAIMPERVQLFSDYLSTVVGKPSHYCLCMKIPFSLKMGKVTTKAPEFEFRDESEVHQLWTISRYQTKKLESFAEKCDQFHLADGHHRLYQYGGNNSREGGALAYVLASNQLYNGAFFWAIKTSPFPELLISKLIEYKFSHPLYLKTKEGLFSISVPDGLHPLLYLYHHILVANEIEISYFPEGTISVEIEKQFSGIFGYNKLYGGNYSLGEKEIQLPPKSTYLTQASNRLVHCPAFNELKKYGKALF